MRSRLPASLCLLPLLPLLAAGCETGAPAQAASGSDLSRAVAMLTGSFSSAAQSKQDAEFKDIRLHAARIWPEECSEDKGYWIYVEQATADRLDKPYRQRVYKVSAMPDGRIRSDVYEFPGAAENLGRSTRFIGAWKDPSRFKEIRPGDLSLKDGCAVILVSGKGGLFSGSTVGTGCPSKLNGAEYVTSIVTLDSRGIRSWDRGYDKSGTQVWGATKGPYEFLRAPDDADIPRSAR